MTLPPYLGADLQGESAQPRGRAEVSAGAVPTWMTAHLFQFLHIRILGLGILEHLTRDTIPFSIFVSFGARNAGL